MDKSLILLRQGYAVCIALLLPSLALAQTHTMPGSNLVPSGASLTIQSGGSITAAAGSTITGFGGGGAPTTSTYITQLPDAGLSAELALSTLSTGLLKSTTTTGALTTITDNSTNWNTAFTQMLQWDGGATNLVASTGRTSLGLGTAATTNATAYEVPLTFSTGLTRTTNTITVNTSQNIATLSNLTTNGFVKTGGAVGTLSVDTATYQASSANLTTWAGIAPGTNVGTFLATPSSANLRGALTDENGTGAALFSGATAPDFTTGFTIGGAAASGKIIVGNGTNFVPSTPTYPNAASPTALKWMRADGTNWIASTATLAEGAVTAGKILQSDATNWVASTATWPTTNTAGYKVQSNGTNYVDYPTDIEASSTATVSSSYAADTYLAGSMITLAAGDWKAQGQYHCKFDMTKTAAGTATPIITVRMGTLGTTGDAAIGTLTFAAGTAAADTGIFDVDVVFRSVGSGTSAVIQIMGECGHLLAATGITATGAAGTGIIVGTSAGFNSTTQTKIGISFNGGSSFVGTNTIVVASLHQP